MTFFAITDRSEASTAFHMLIEALQRAAGSPTNIKVAFRPTWREVEAYWFLKYRFWCAPGYTSEQKSKRKRHWILFGTEDPTDPSAKRSNKFRITVEMNPPLSGIDRRLAGVFLRDDNQKVYIGHTGGVGGGKKGVGPAAFRAFANTTRWQNFEEDGEPREAVVFGPLDDPALLLQFRAFIDRVQKFKDEA